MDVCVVCALLHSDTNHVRVQLHREWRSGHIVSRRPHTSTREITSDARVNSQQSTLLCVLPASTPSVTRHGTLKTWWGRVAPGSMGHAAWDAPFPTVKVGDSEVAADRRGCVERRTQAQVRSRRATVSAPWGRDPALSFPCLAARCNGRMPNPASPYQLTVMTSMLALASTAPASPPDGAGTSMAPDFA